MNPLNTFAAAIDETKTWWNLFSTFLITVQRELQSLTSMNAVTSASKTGSTKV